MSDNKQFNKWIIAFVLFNIMVTSGFVFEYRQLNQNSRKLLETQHLLQDVQEQQQVFHQSLKVIHQQLHEKNSQIALLNQIIWLIRQAKWQLKIMHQATSAEHLLQYAQKIAKANHWTTLEDALSEDLYQLKRKNLILDNDLIENIQTLYQQIEVLQKRASLHQTLTVDKKEPIIIQDQNMQNILNRLKPFISIERFHQPIPKILPPAQQYQVLSNMLMLLTEMQMTGLNRDDKSYRVLSKALNDNWHTISPQLQEPKITESIEKLKSVQLILEKPMFFTSFAEVHHLLDSAGKNL
jgi:hypothetical protein